MSQFDVQIDNARPSTLPVDPELARPPDSRHRGRTASRALLVAIGLAGALGALARFGVGRAVPTTPGGVPWGTLLVNISGSLGVGFALVMLADRLPRARLVRPVVVTGFLGGYTTFSTYVVEADTLFRHHDLAVGAAYGLGSLLAGTGAALAGILLARAVVRLERAKRERAAQ